MKRKLLKLSVSALAAALAVLLCFGRMASGYVEVAYPLGKVVAESTNIVFMIVESVDKQKNTIIYKKVRDIKGQHPSDTIKHHIGQAGFSPVEWQTVMAWAEVGKTAIFFHNGSAAETCIENYWYQTPVGGDWMNMTHSEPFLARTYYGKPDKLAVHIANMLQGQEVIVPCMVDGDKEAIKKKTAKIHRMKASLKIQDYNPARDFVDFGTGGDELRPIAGMPGFTHFLALSRIGAGAQGIAAADLNNDGRSDLAVFSARQLSLLQNAGNAFDELRLPMPGGARGVSWADYDGDKKPDVFVASPSGPRLFRNITEKSAQFEDVSPGLPRQNYFSLTAGTFMDYDGDGKPDILVADGFRGLRLYRNLGVTPAPAAAAKSTTGKWFYAGPFDNSGQKGFDTEYPPEKGVDLAKEYVGKNNEKVVWKEGNFTDGQVNGLALFKPEHNNDCVVYLYRELNAASDIECPISLGSDDTLTVWVNGQKVHAENVYRGAAPDQALIKAKLKAGKNTLLLKICQGSGDFAFYCMPRLTEAQPLVPPLFEDVSDKVGLGENGIGKDLKGDRLVAADVDGDGRQDFLFTGGTGLLALNKPSGFVEAKDSGISFKCGGFTPAFGDINGDGKLDLFVPQSGNSLLFKNNGSGKFSDVTAQSGDLAKTIGDARGAAFVEFAKGRQDLLVGCWKSSNRYFKNDGKGTFTDRTEEIGLAYKMFNTTAVSVQDLNKDNFPDVVFNNEGQEPVLLIAKPSFFADPVAQAVDASGKPITADKGAAPSGGVGAIGAIALIAAAVFVAMVMRRKQGAAAIALLLLAGAAGTTVSAGEWTTARGNAERTGNVDGQQGPKTPNILWVHKAQEHYIASPVPYGKSLYLSVVGALNTGSFHALSLEPAAPERMRWTKTVPFIARPTVCAPAVADGMVIFGDGMHQTDDAFLYCLNAETGMPFWRYAVPGKLVHLEAGPCVDNGRVYVCGGDAGIMCIDAKRVTLEGKEQDLNSVAPILAKRWAELVAKYEAEKKKDPLLAIPPSEDALPKPTPKLVWQGGKDKWHIDAPPVVAGDFLLVASSYLEEEKEGKRSLVCLKKSDGSLVWETPLDLNPWSGATVSGQTVIVGCSNIRFDRKLIGNAKGQVIALDLASGQVKWKKEITGAVLSPVAVKGEVAIYTSTNGEVVARNVNTSQRVWTYNAKQPLFAGVAIAGEAVYAADLYGGVHALNLADGQVQWHLELSTDPNIQSKSMVFGSPVVHGGDVYIATCNPDGDTPQSSYVVCLSDKAPVIAQKFVPVTVDKAKRSVSIPCRVAPRKLPALKEIYPLEVVATFPAPRGQKAHETVVVFDSKPSEVHAALESIGLKAGAPAVGEGAMSSGAEVKISLEVPGVAGVPRLIPMEKLVVDTRTGKTLPKLKWHFTGSVMRQPDPTKSEKVYGADQTGTLISLLPVTDETVCQLHLSLADGKPLRLDTNKELLPPEGTEVKLIIEAK
ncbi:MAG TPA: FG-GAP-like repeat-containing protein [Planctomycetota bacterium]|nr:FG-GAP-like repeat-containing protein [Planctomycetota bacterium]